MIGNNMVPTTMYWPKDLYRKIGLVASLKQKPKVSVVRDLVEKNIDKEFFEQSNAKQVFDVMGKFQFRGGPKDLAKNHDHYAWD